MTSSQDRPIVRWFHVFHRWTHWERTVWQISDGPIECQKRTCRVCGKQQVEAFRI